MHCLGWFYDDPCNTCSHRGGSECKCWWQMLPFNCVFVVHCAGFPKKIWIPCIIKSVWLIGDVHGCRVKSFVLWSLHFSLEWRRWNYETIIHNYVISLQRLSFPTSSRPCEQFKTVFGFFPKEKFVSQSFQFVCIDWKHVIALLGGLLLKI